MVKNFENIFLNRTGFCLFNIYNDTGADRKEGAA
jgi:hypothetical protein